jgi:hypothetical protein
MTITAQQSILSTSLIFLQHFVAFRSMKVTEQWIFSCEVGHGTIGLTRT